MRIVLQREWQRHCDVLPAGGANSALTAQHD
jgi:hypothetical protein